VASESIDNAWKISWVYQADQFPEITTFGIHTYARTSDEFPDIFDWAEDFLADTATVVMCACTMIRFTISEWSTGPGFTGWHQIGARDSSLAFGSGNPLPHQDALVVGVRNLVDPEFAIGRRRNRFYLGPIKASILQTDSRMSSTLQGNMSTLLADEHDQLSGTQPVAGKEGLNGFAVVSPAQGKIMTPDELSLGRRFDVIRSRADHVPESVVYTALSP